MESKRTILNNILRIVSAEEARNQALTEEFRSMRKELADQWGEICCTVLQTEKTQKTLVAMMRELITEVKNLHTHPVLIEEMCRLQAEKKPQPLPLSPSMNNDVVKPRRISTREKDLFSNTKTHYDYKGVEKTVGQAKAVKMLKAEGLNLGEKPFRFLHRLVKDLGVAEIPTKAKNAKSGNYRIYVKDLQKIRDYLG